MSQGTTSFGGSIPQHYDEHMGPVIFAPYAKDMAQRVAALGPNAVLECAAGTGRLTHELRAALPTSCELTSTDLNPDMMRLAQDRLPEGSVKFQVADATSLPFEDASFDVVVTQFGAMFFPDKVLGHREARRVLRPGGRYLFSVWGSLQENPWATAVQAAMGDLVPEDQPMFFSVPFMYADPEQLRADMSAAGFVEVGIERVEMEFWAPTARSFAIGAVHGSPLSTALRERGAEDLDAAVAAVTERFAAECGREPMKSLMVAYVVSAPA
jgi:ubiquinone/menaquinone biosynthesis C-methylase UbiE